MFGKKKLINILCISLLLSLSVICSAAHFFIDDSNSSNISVSVLFTLVWVLSISVAFVMKNGAVLIFSACYFGIGFVSWFLVTLLSIFDVSFFPIDLLTCAFFYPFLGYGLLTSFGEYIILILNLLFSFAAYLLLRKSAKKQN